MELDCTAQTDMREMRGGSACSPWWVLFFVVLVCRRLLPVTCYWSLVTCAGKSVTAKKKALAPASGRRGLGTCATQRSKRSDRDLTYPSTLLWVHSCWSYTPIPIHLQHTLRPSCPLHPPPIASDECCAPAHLHRVFQAKMPLHSYLHIPRLARTGYQPGGAAWWLQMSNLTR